MSVSVIVLTFYLTFCFSYEPGDVVMIQPQNPADSVQDFIKLLQLEPNQEFILESSESGKI